MKESELKVFIESTQRYFEQISRQAPQIGVPHPKSSDFTLLDYTGAIGISGTKKGCIYVTADERLLKNLITQMDPAMASSEEAIIDMAGEMANNIAGNAQNAFGSEFMISVPMIITGRPTDLKLPLKLPVFVIPFSWQDSKAFVVVGIE